MTIAPERPSPSSPALPAARAARPARGGRVRAALFPVGWPIMWAVAGWALWWALGVSVLVLPACGILLARDLRVRLRRSGGRLRTPPGFWIWCTYIVLSVISGVMLNKVIPGTLPPHGVGRFLAVGSRIVDYSAVGVLALYLINTPERELPRLRVLRWLSALAVVCVLLGLASIAKPGFEFRSPLSLVLPQGAADALSGQTGKLSLAQLQAVLGVVDPRPAAPFAFTNAWGNVLALTLVALVLVALARGTRTRLAAAAVVVVSVVPIVYSLNRGMWIGLVLLVLYVVVRLALRGRVALLAALVVLLGVGGAAFVASPLQSIVTARASHGHSNDIRTALAQQALRSADLSPLVGWGSTRAVLGSGASIAVGRSADCPKCGNAEIGSTGQYFLLLVSQGWVGLVVYVGYFLRTLWAYRRDASPLGIGATGMLLMSLFFGVAYTALIMPLMIIFLAIGLLWRNDDARRAARSAGLPRPHAAGPARSA